MRCSTGSHIRCGVGELGPWSLETHIVPSANRASADYSICCQIKPGISTKTMQTRPGGLELHRPTSGDGDPTSITLDCQAGFTLGR